MKKRILTLAMCLAISATSVLAAANTKEVKSTAKKVPAKVEKQVESKKLKSKDDARKNFEAKMAERREAFYQELGLSAEQKAKSEVLDAKTRDDMEALHKKFRAEKQKIAEESKKNFEDILTKDQKVRFEKLDKERKAKMEKMRKERKNGEFKNMPPKESMEPEQKERPQD